GQDPAWTARRDHRDGEHPRGDTRGGRRATAGAAGRERLCTGGRGERDLHVVPGPDRRVSGARRAPARLARRAPARRRRGRGAGRAAALHPRAAALLYHKASAPAETYVPAGGGEAAAGSRDMTGGQGRSMAVEGGP